MPSVFALGKEPFALGKGFAERSTRQKNFAECFPVVLLGKLSGYYGTPKVNTINMTSGYHHGGHISGPLAKVSQADYSEFYIDIGYLHQHATQKHREIYLP